MKWTVQFEDGTVVVLDRAPLLTEDDYYRESAALMLARAIESESWLGL